MLGNIEGRKQFVTNVTANMSMILINTVKFLIAKHAFDTIKLNTLTTYKRPIGLAVVCSCSTVYML